MIIIKKEVLKILEVNHYFFDITFMNNFINYFMIIKKKYDKHLKFKIFNKIS